MSKPAKKPSTAPAAPVPAAKPSSPTSGEPKSKKADPGSKQSRVITMLRSPNGTTIAAMMKATGWQQHSVRGFLTGVVRKKLKLNLDSKKIDGSRVYSIKGADGNKASPRHTTRRAAGPNRPRVTDGPAPPDNNTLENQIARLRDLDIRGLQTRWHNAFGRRPPPHLPRHLMFRVLAYRLQADRLGDLDAGSQRLLDGAGPAEDAGKRAIYMNLLTADLSPGTMLAREWNGRMQRVAVLADGFAWNGKTYPSLSKVAFAITGTRWNGPRFFGLRDKSSEETRS